MAKQRDPYDSIRSYSPSSGTGGSSSYRGGSGSKKRDPYAAIASYKSKQLTDEEQKAKDAADTKSKLQANSDKSKPKTLADLARSALKGGSAVGRFLFEGTGKLINTAIAEGKQVGYTTQMLAANASKNPEAFRHANEASRNAYKNDNAGKNGLLDVGTVFKNGKEAQSGELKTGLKRIGGGTLQSAAEVVPIGIQAKGASLASRIAKGAAGGAGAAGLGSVGAQLVNDGKVSIPKTLSDLAAGGVLGGAAGGLIGSKVASKVKGAVADKIPTVGASREGIKIQSMATRDKARAAGKLRSTLSKDLIDSNHPVRELTQQIESVLGRKLDINEDPYQLLKLRAGVEGQASTHLKDTADWMSKVPKELREDADRYGYAKQYLSQADKRTPEQLQAAQDTLDQLSKKYGSDMSVFEDYTQKTRQSFDSLVDLYEKEGMISKAHADNLRANPDYFAKMEVLQDETGKLLRNGGTVNVREASALKGIKGQANGAALAPSAESYVKQTVNTMQDIANNRVGRSLGELADKLGDNGPIMRLRDTQNVLGRQEIYSELKKTKELRDGLKVLSRDHKDAIKTIEREMRKLKAQGAAKLQSKSKEARNAIIKGANDGAALPGSGSQIAKLPADANDVERILNEWINSDKSGLKGIVDRLAAKDQKVADMKSDLETIEGSLSRVLTQRKDLWDKAQKLRDADLPKGYTRVSYLDNGVRNEVAVPEEVGKILTGADKQTFDIVTSTIGKLHNVFRQAVTTYNPLFVFLRNPARDFKSFAINSRYVPARKAVQAYAGGLMDSLTGGKWKEEFLRSGGGQAGYFAREGGQYGKQIAKAAQDITGKRSAIKRVVTSPRDFMQAVSEAIEAAPRVAEYKYAKKAGASNAAAAIAGREVTVDFAQGGSFSRVANQWIPFLNARAQGVRRTMQAFRENPKRALTVWGATGIVPIATLAAWNNQHKDVWNNIPDYEKENNFIFILGNHKDKAGRYDQVIKVPKGDVDKILGNTFETMLDQYFNGHGDGADALKKSLISGASNLSPVGFANNGNISASSVMSGILPPTVKAPVETATNYSFFKDAPIVPDNLLGAPANEQVSPNTSGLARAVGGTLNQSPLKVENIMNNLMGSVPSDVANALTMNRGTADRFVRGAAGTSGNKIETEFWKTYGPAKQTRDYREKQIYKLIDQGSYKQAQRKADEYNRDVDQRFSKYFKQNGAYVPDQFDSGISPYEMINSLKLDVQISKKGKAYIKR